MRICHLDWAACYLCLLGCVTNRSLSSGMTGHDPLWLDFYMSTRDMMAHRSTTCIGGRWRRGRFWQQCGCGGSHSRTLVRFDVRWWCCDAGDVYDDCSSRACSLRRWCLRSLSQRIMLCRCDFDSNGLHSRDLIVDSLCFSFRSGLCIHLCGRQCRLSGADADNFCVRVGLKQCCGSWNASILRDCDWIG